MNRTVICSTIHIQQQHTDIHKNLIISDKVQQKYEYKQQNNQIKKKQQASNSIKQENMTNSWTIKMRSAVCTWKNEDLL